MCFRVRTHIRVLQCQHTLAELVSDSRCAVFNKADGTLQQVVSCGMVLGEAIGKIFGALAPAHQKLFLGDSVLHPAEARVDSFGAALLDGSIGKAGSC